MRASHCEAVWRQLQDLSRDCTAIPTTAARLQKANYALRVMAVNHALSKSRCAKKYCSSPIGLYERAAHLFANGSGA
jgi:nucleotidyltransferase/DNA polymerase involved in DNA repair